MADDNSWVFDSLVCFLHGPVWNAPLQTFIEERSIIFDPNVELDPTNEEYKKVHEEYKNLVDFMLGSFMEEMQITPEKFEMACMEGRHQTGPNNPLSFHQRLFQQIWAANDVRIFIRMMTQRNVELQLQALDLIERRQGSRESKSDSVEGSDLTEFNEQGGDEDLIKDNVEFLLEEDKIKASVSTAAARGSDGDPDGSITDKFQRLNLFFEKEKVDEKDVKQRREYLRAQRDKILEIKKKTRARQLNESVKTNSRPTSAQVAQKLLAGEAEPTVADPPESSLKLRQVLAQRLRNEVVDSDALKPHQI